MPITAQAFPTIAQPAYFRHTEINILKSVNDFADSFGLKPFKLDLLNYDDIKESKSSSSKKSLPAHPAAKFILFSVYTRISNNQVNEFIDQIIRSKQSSTATLIHFRRYLNQHINKTDAEGKTWAYRQTQTAIENLKTNAAGGKPGIRVITDFNNKEINRIYELEEQGLNSVAIAGIYPFRNEEIVIDLGSHHRETPRYQFV